MDLVTLLQSLESISLLNIAIRPEDNIVDIHIPKDSGGYINNTREDFSFKFNGIMPMETKQDQVFDIVAKDVYTLMCRL